MFFEDYWEAEIKPHISPRTVSKVIITGEATHKELLDKVE